MENRNKNTLSIICVYNNKSILNDMFLTSIKKQTVQPELILIDNNELKFASAAEALNYGASQSTGDYLVFMHQDLELQNERFLEEIVGYFENLGPVVLGIAGKRHDDHPVYTNIRHGKNHEYAGDKRVNGPVEVHTLDEVLLSIPRELFVQYKFDEHTCSNWHLYGVDLCLTLGSNNIKSYVVPCEAYHKSTGNINSGFLSSLNRLIKKHKTNYKRISSTCVDVKTNTMSFVIYKLKFRLLRVEFISKLNNYKNKKSNKYGK